MSRAIGDFVKKCRQRFDLVKKFNGVFTAGSRILPSRTSKNDAEFQFRLDAGELIQNRYRNIILQVNSQATTPGLKDWLRKHGSDGKLAQAQFDTLAEDMTEEVDRVIDDLTERAKENLKD